MPDFFRTSIGDPELIRGAARVLWCGTTIAFPVKIGDVINLSTYDAQVNWFDLGATKTGVNITVNNTEEAVEVDQVIGDLAVFPVSWECSVQTSLAEMNLDRLNIAWEGGGVTTDTSMVPNEKVMGFGMPVSYVQRRLAVLHQRPSGKVRAYIFRKVQRSAVESSAAFNKTGEQQSAPVRFRGFADLSIVDIYQRFFIIRDQQ